MYDNGLLKYFRQRYSKDGFLDVKGLRIKEVGRGSIFDTTVRCKSPSGYFYKKFHNYFSKEMADAEILLSQIYNRAGIQSAVYLPVKEDENCFVLSNDVAHQDGVVCSRDFHYYLSTLQNEQKSIRSQGEVFSGKSESSEILKHFTNNALRQKILMRTLDVASNNPDRQDCNYFYRYNENKQADSVLVIDHERSGITTNAYLSIGRNAYESKYANDFGEGDLDKWDVIQQIKENEQVNSVYPHEELASKIGSVDVHETALDIARSTGYVVEPKYVDCLASSFSQVAEALQG